MKRTNKLIFLLIVLVLMISGALVVALLNPAEEESAGEQRLLNIEDSDVTAISWTHEGEVLSFTREGDEWIYDQDPDAKAKSTTIDGMVMVLTDTVISRTVENPDVLSAYGLEEPGCVITVTTDSRTYEIAIGNKAQVTGTSYLYIGDGKVYLEGGESKLESTFSYDVSGVVYENYGKAEGEPAEEAKDE